MSGRPGGRGKANASSFRALLVAAHPDDIEFACAGTVARWTDLGAKVTYCIVTDGSTGTQERDRAGESLAQIRRDESLRAAKAVGVDDVVFLGLRDGYVTYSLELRREIARVFRQKRPHRYVVMDPAPTFGDNFVNHPDHKAVGSASLDVVLTAGTTPGHFPDLLDEGIRPWRGLRELWMMGPGNRPIACDISATIERKIQALLCHRTQVGEDAERIEQWVRRRAAEIGEAHGYGYAETFNVIREGPGFHPDEDLDDAVDLAGPPIDPTASPLSPPEH